MASHDSSSTTTLTSLPTTLPPTKASISESSTAGLNPPLNYTPQLPSYHDAVTSNFQHLTYNQLPSYTATSSFAISQPQYPQPLIAQAINSPPIVTEFYCDDELPFINDDDEFGTSPPSYYALFTRKEEELLRLIRDYDGFNRPADTAEAICKWLIMIVILVVVVFAMGTSLGWGRRWSTVVKWFIMFGTIPWERRFGVCIPDCCESDVGYRCLSKFALCFLQYILMIRIDECLPFTFTTVPSACRCCVDSIHCDRQIRRKRKLL